MKHDANAEEDQLYGPAEQNEHHENMKNKDYDDDNNMK